MSLLVGIILGWLLTRVMEMIRRPRISFEPTDDSEFLRGNINFPRPYGRGFKGGGLNSKDNQIYLPLVIARNQLLLDYGANRSFALVFS